MRQGRNLGAGVHCRKASRIKGFRAMQVVAEGMDGIRLGFLRAVLADAEIGAVILDAGMAAMGLGVVPARLAVRDADAERARRIVADADG
mgnify:CR=1 FL=1